MPDFSIIKNQRLSDLIQKSLKFRALPQEKRENHLQKIAELSEEKKEELIDFFKTENAKEVEKLRLLTEFYNRIVELEKKYRKIIKNEEEYRLDEQDKKTMEAFLTSTMRHPRSSHG